MDLLLSLMRCMDRWGRPGNIIAAVAGIVGTGIVVGRGGEIAGGNVGGVSDIDVVVGGGGGEGGGGDGGEGRGGRLGRGAGGIGGPGHVLRLSVGVEDAVEASKGSSGQGNWRRGHLVAIGGGLEVRVNCSK